MWPTDELPKVPDLVELWARSVDPHDVAGADRLCADLAMADSQLGDLHEELRRRFRLATGELLARYRAEPSLAFGLLS